MNAAQPGIFAIGTRHHFHLELDVSPRATPSMIRGALAELRQHAALGTVANVVVGFGPGLWRVLAADSSRSELHDFELVGDPSRRHAPATQHDLWWWIHGGEPDFQLDLARLITRSLADVALLAAEQACFTYRDSRDLTGFIDGTENPPVPEAVEVALVPDGSLGAYGSFAMTMKWVHDLDSFHALAESEQEKVFGRTKPASVELDDAAKPPTAHIARVVIEEHGEELEIFRRSTPYGTVREHGLYFVAFSADPTRFDKMLARMYGTTGDGLHDRLTEYTRPVSGSYYFVPSIDALASALRS